MDKAFCDLLCVFAEQGFMAVPLEQVHGITGCKPNNVRITRLPKFYRIEFQYEDGPSYVAAEVLVTDNEQFPKQHSADLCLPWLFQQVKRRFKVLGRFTPGVCNAR